MRNSVGGGNPPAKIEACPIVIDRLQESVAEVINAPFVIEEPFFVAKAVSRDVGALLGVARRCARSPPGACVPADSAVPVTHKGQVVGFKYAQ